METNGQKRIKSARIRSVLLAVGSILLMVCTDNKVLVETTFVRYWIWDVLDTFSLYFCVALIALIWYWDKRVWMGTIVFSIAAFLEVMQLLQIKLPIAPLGTFDPWDFVAYFVGIAIAVLLDNALNKRHF